MQNNGSTIFSFHFKSCSEFLICCTFKNSSSSSFCYTFASHGCYLGSHTTFFLSFDSFKSLSKHATIVVHENCWDSLKGPPDFFTFMWYSCAMWVITKLSLPCKMWMAQVPKPFPTCCIKLQRHLQRMFKSTLVKLNMHQTHFNYYLYCWRTR